jgi:hypothetical protein
MSVAFEHPLWGPLPPLLSFPPRCSSATPPCASPLRRAAVQWRVLLSLAHSPLCLFSFCTVLCQVPRRADVAPLAAHWSLSHWTDGHKAPSGGHKHTQDTMYTRTHTGHASKRAKRMVPAPCASAPPPPSCLLHWPVQLSGPAFQWRRRQWHGSLNARAGHTATAAL